MAIIFELWAECKDEQSLSQLARHFEGFQHTLSVTGRTITASIEIIKSRCFAIRVTPSGLSHAGVRTIQDALETTEIGLQLYSHLKSGPGFIFARVDWEASNITMLDLPEWVKTLQNGNKRFDIECVVDNALYEQMGKPIFCYPFRSGYWWTRYRGETYRPLYSNDQESLNEFCKKLFPEYFAY
jgi:hypothetical protein